MRNGSDEKPVFSSAVHSGGDAQFGLHDEGILCILLALSEEGKPSAWLAALQCPGMPEDQSRPVLLPARRGDLFGTGMGSLLDDDHRIYMADSGINILWDPNVGSAGAGCRVTVCWNM